LNANANSFFILAISPANAYYLMGRAYRALYTKKSGSCPLFNEAFLATTPWDSHSSMEILEAQGQKTFSIRQAGSLTNLRFPFSSK
jgi:hypothetical protein